jgi:hypothetical protein
MDAMCSTYTIRVSALTIVTESLFSCGVDFYWWELECSFEEVSVGFNYVTLATKMESQERLWKALYMQTRQLAFKILGNFKWGSHPSMMWSAKNTWYRAMQYYSLVTLSLLSAATETSYCYSLSDPPVWNLVWRKSEDHLKTVQFSLWCPLDRRTAGSSCCGNEKNVCWGLKPSDSVHWLVDGK